MRHIVAPKHLRAAVAELNRGLWANGQSGFMEPNTNGQVGYAANRQEPIGQ